MDHINDLFVSCCFDTADIAACDPLLLEATRHFFETKQSLEEPTVIIHEVEQEVFPWSGGGVVGYFKLPKELARQPLLFNVAAIHKYSHPVLNKLPRPVARFATDSGLLILTDFCALPVLSRLLSFDELVEEPVSNQKYLTELQEQMSMGRFYVISTPGINKGTEFVGSGRYFFSLDAFLLASLS